MARSEQSIEIARPAADVFPYLAAGDARLRWMGKLVQSRQLTNGAVGLGTRFRDVFEDGGRRFELEAEVTAWEPNERVEIRLAGRGFGGKVSNFLEERDGVTRLRVVVETNFHGFAARLVAGVITRQAERQLAVDLARLKELVESDGTG